MRRYGAVAMTLHWLVAILFLCAAAGGWLMSRLDFSTAMRGDAYTLHKSVGLLILAIVLVRLRWRLRTRPTPPAGSGWEPRAALFVHRLFYALLIATPLVGWFIVSTAGRQPTEFFFLFDVPNMPVPKNAAMAQTAAAVHLTLVVTIVALLTVHVGAALKHHFLMKDDVFLQMVPGRDGQSDGRRAVMVAFAAILALVALAAIVLCSPEKRLPPQGRADAAAPRSLPNPNR